MANLDPHVREQEPHLQPCPISIFGRLCKFAQRGKKAQSFLKKSLSTSAHSDVNLSHNLALLGTRTGLFHSWFSKPRHFPLSWSPWFYFRRKRPQQSSRWFMDVPIQASPHPHRAWMQICLSRANSFTRAATRLQIPPGAWRRWEILIPFLFIDPSILKAQDIIFHSLSHKDLQPRWGIFWTTDSNFHILGRTVECIRLISELSKAFDIIVHKNYSWK